MFKDASKIFEIITEFCRNNLDILMIGGVAVIVLIILISSIKFYKDKEDEDVELDEAELMEIVEQVKLLQSNDCDLDQQESLAEQESLGEEEQEPELDVEVALPPLTAAIVLEEEEIFEASSEDPGELEASAEAEELEECDEPEEELQEPQESQVPAELEEREVPFVEPEGEEVSKENYKEYHSIESLVEEIAALSGTGVKEVEIKVAGANVKITYANKEDAIRGESAILDNAELVSKELIREANKEESKEGNMDLCGVVSSGDTVRKFGPDNMNVARSGKVYSEEELQKQIRD